MPKRKTPSRDEMINKFLMAEAGILNLKQHENFKIDIPERNLE